MDDDSDDEENVDWEDGETDLIDIANNNIEICPDSIPDNILPKTNKKRCRPKNFSALRENAIENHRNQLSRLVNRAIKLSRYCSDEMLLNIMLSMVPPFLLENSCTGRGFDYLSRLASWFIPQYRVISPHDMTVEEGRDGSDADDLCMVISKKAGSAHQICQLFTTMLRSLNFNARYVCSIFPTPPQVKDFTILMKQQGFEIPDEEDGYSSSSYKNLELGAFDRKISSFCWMEVLLTEDDPNKNIETPLSLNLLQGAKESNGTSVIDLINPENEGNSSIICLSSSPTTVNGVDTGVDTINGSLDTHSSPMITKSSQISYQYNVTSSRWTHFDPIRNLFNKPMDVQRCLSMEAKKRVVIPYVLAIDNEGKVTDVSDRYCPCQQTRKRFRLDMQEIDYWISLINSHNDKNTQRRKLRASELSIATSSSSNSSTPNYNNNHNTNSMNNGFHSNISEKEQQELMEHAVYSTSRLPTSYSAFKSHPYYILEKDIGSNKAINPNNKKAIGTFKGQGIYLRSDVSDLHTISQWKKLGRDIDEGQNPISIITRKKSSIGVNYNNNNTIYYNSRASSKPSSSSSSSCSLSDDNSNNSNNSQGVEVELFGIWQTRPYEPPIVCDNIIPMNEFGNVEFWGYNKALLPIGTSHVAGSQAVVVAKELAMPYAPALIDFETKNGKRVPVIDGIVVLLEHAVVIEEATAAVVQQKLQNTAMKREQILVHRWEMIVKGVINRVKLKEVYGH